MVSVIINTKDRLQDLCSCVKSLLFQQHPIDELIIVDASQNSDQVKEAVEKLLLKSEICLKFFHTKAGNSYQRNVGINNLNKLSKFVCFFDDDVVLFPETIAVYLKKFRQWPDVVAIQGIEVNRKVQHLLGKLVRKLFFIAHEGRSWKHLPSGENVIIINPIGDQYIGSFMTGFVCVKKCIVDEYKFDEWFEEYAFLEDFDFSYRISRKYNLLISPEIKFIHNKYLIDRKNNFYTCKMYIINKTYVFTKHVPYKKLYYKFAFVWSLLGHIILCAGKSIYRMDAGFLGGTCSGIFSICSVKFNKKK